MPHLRYRRDHPYGDCHAPSNAERALFVQLADEIDAYLAGADESADAGLWSEEEA